MIPTMSIAMAEMFGCLIFGRAKLVCLVIGLTQMP